MRYTASPRDERLTIEEYAQLPDDGWWSELVRGMVVREPQPGNEHGTVQANVIAALHVHVREHAPDLKCLGNFGVITDEAGRTVRGPDAAVVRRSRLDTPGRAGFLNGAPDLAVEVVSPWNRAGDIQAKVREYLEAGSSLVWVIYPETRTVAVHSSPTTARFFDEHETLDGGDLLPELRLPIVDLFRD